ncbi:MAG TPA: hypothetical protein PLN17_05045 [Candidatus Cloacimonas sp.]|jgi:predicted membrane protein|nr:hypothetical protein [Candidatus Cloacimonas sp.]MDD4676240.1 hypothetical protein [Candidatus Cloacimonadota bacterium]MCK9157546.1 cell wall-active antibiotics response protein [Candidatus Cloacimonas sp.]MCK9164765.1 cell wall-active antibiotics response protein [Candidatus Cloacimonas sp.]HPN27060.1 hypothetical protein [Candidatus Cloacimonas sp.]
MKMNFVFSNFFWGLFFILLGLSVFLKAFNIHLPLVRVFIAIIIIMIGIKLLFGLKSHHYHKPKSYSKENSIYYSSSRDEYNIIFSSGIIDLSDLPENAKDFEITVVFGSGTVILPDNIAVNINPTSVFGSTILPPKNPVTQDKPVEIESTVVFGRLEYKYAKAEQTTEQTTEPQ